MSKEYIAPNQDACYEFALKALDLMELIADKYEIRNEDQNEYIRVCLKILQESLNHE